MTISEVSTIYLWRDLLHVRSPWSHLQITFLEADLKLTKFPHTDAMVIEALIAGWNIGKILVDTGSSADILFASTLDQMKLSRNSLPPVDKPLFGFGGNKIQVLGKITLPVSFGTMYNARIEKSPLM